MIDRSGSMAIGDRFKTAVDEIEKLLAEVPDGIGVGVYAFDRKATAVTESNYPKIDDSLRRRIHDKLENMGVNPLGYTDLVAGLAPAISGEPDAIYLFSDGVPTIGEPSSSAVVKGLRDKLAFLPADRTVLVHVVALSGGTYDTAIPRTRKARARSSRRSPRATGGRYRELVAQPHTDHLALRPIKETAPEPDPVKFNLYGTDGPGQQDQGLPGFKIGNEFFLPEIVAGDFLVEIEDPALVQGPVILEYAARPEPPRIELGATRARIRRRRSSTRRRTSSRSARTTTATTT